MQNIQQSLVDRRSLNGLQVIRLHYNTADDVEKYMTVIRESIKVIGLGQNKSKINFLEELCDSNSIFIVLTESHLNSSIEDSEIQINNFSVTRCDRKDRKGGGVVLYVKSSFTTRTLLSYCNTVCEVL